MISNDDGAEATLRQLLLGALGDEERLALEERLLMDPPTFDTLELAERTLSEAYVAGELSPGDRQRFERHYLTTSDRCRQVTMMRLVRDRARTGLTAPRPVTSSTVRTNRRPAHASPAALLVLTGALCLALGSSAWLVVRQASLRREFDAVSAQRAWQQAAVSQLSEQIVRLSARAAELEDPAATAPPPAARTPAAALGVPVPDYALTAGALRDAGTPVRVAVPPGAAVVHLDLPLPDAGFNAYRATVYDADGEERWSVSKLIPAAGRQAATLRLVAAADLLVRGDYEIRVSGIAADGHLEPVATYPFRRP
jgi:hypothetical protein